MRDDIITFFKSKKYRDSDGVWKNKKERRDAFCKVASISMSEFYEAGRNGLNPEFRFHIFPGDYHGESECEYRGQHYSIYRTYESDLDTLELYVERKGGTNGKGNQC